MLAIKRPEVNPGNLPRAGDESPKQGIHPGFETQGQTSPEVRYWRISGPTKRTDIRKKFKKKKIGQMLKVSENDFRGKGAFFIVLSNH